MRIFLILLTFFVLFGAAAPAQAGEKPWVFGWWPGHWGYTEFKKFNPYIENGKHPHNMQWNDRTWYAEDWLTQRENGQTLINDFYRTGVLYDQTDDDGIPVLIVGPNFYRLSGYDKRRVMHVVDVVHGVTDQSKNGMFILKDWHTRLPVGIYTETGLQLQ